MNELTSDEQGMLVDDIHDSATVIHKGQRMNQLIRSLYYECQDESQSTEQCYQKFAKLIVRECAEQSMSIGRYNTPSGVTPDLSIAIAVGLKKHFGIEE